MRQNYSLWESIELVDMHEEFGSEFLDEALTHSVTTQDSTICLPNPDPILNATCWKRADAPHDTNESSSYGHQTTSGQILPFNCRLIHHILI
jgi:hypothetical protein